jgi:hypothetical protein
MSPLFGGWGCISLMRNQLWFYFYASRFPQEHDSFKLKVIKLIKVNNIHNIFAS